MSIFINKLHQTGARIAAHEARARVDGYSNITPSNTPIGNRGGNMFDERYRLMAIAPGMSVHHRHLNLLIMLMQTMARGISDQLESLK